MTLSDLVEGSLATLEDLARRHSDAIWEIGFSGGKDSTLLLHLVVEFLGERAGRGLPLPKAVYVVYEDTLLEVPPLRKIALKVLEDLKVYSQDVLGGLVKIKVVRPLESRDFFSMMIDKGYPAPHYRFRWCVRVLKVEPMRTFLTDLEAQGPVVMLTGLRADESMFRRRVIRYRMRKGNKKRGLVMATPIINWREEEVLSFLRKQRQPWNGHNYMHLLRLYDYMTPLRSRGARKVRYGCWVCTVISREKALHRLKAEGLCPYAQVLIEAKEDLRAISKRREFRLRGRGRWKLGRLNRLGRLAVIGVLAQVLTEAKEALAAYLENPALRRKLVEWLTALNRGLSKLKPLYSVRARVIREAFSIVSSSEYEFTKSSPYDLLWKECRF